MRFPFRFIYVVIFFTAVLIGTVYLRNADNRVCFKLYKLDIRQSRLKQQLWQKQLRVENLLNPALITEGMNQNKVEPEDE